MKAITLAAWRRPAYTKQVIDSIRNAEGVADYALLIGIDGGGHEDVVKLARQADFIPSQVLINNRHVGCNLNTKYILMHAFSHFDYVIHLEDDTPIAPDALRFFEWACQYGLDKSVFSVGAWGCLPRPGVQEQDGEVAVKRRHFSVWAWATWKDRWLELQRDWTTESDVTLSWDYQVDKIRGGRFQIQPIISRSNNIGSELGTHRGDCLLYDWAGAKGFKAPASYRLDQTR